MTVRDFTLPNAGDFDVEDLYNDETDRYDNRRLKVECPSCGRRSAPLCSPNTTLIESGWRWVGLDHKEPYSDFQTRCAGCKSEYLFSTHVPQ